MCSSFKTDKFMANVVKVTVMGVTDVFGLFQLSTFEPNFKNQTQVLIIY